MSTRRASQLTIAYSPTWKQQEDWDIPLGNADLTRAFPATSRNYFDVEETTEDVLDCTGEDFLFEILTSQFARLTVDFDVDPELLAGVSAFCFGSAVSPTGGTSEVQEEVITATGGTRTLTFQVGADAQTTTALAYNANAAAIQAALEALSNIGVGDVTVSGTGTVLDPIVYTFGGALDKQDLNQLFVNTYALTGGTSTITTTTPGLGQVHLISRIVGVSLPLMTLYVGFRNSDKQPVVFKNVVVDSIRVRSVNREKVTCTMVLVGSAEFDHAVGYTMPPCTDIGPIPFTE